VVFGFFLNLTSATRNPLNGLAQKNRPEVSIFAYYFMTVAKRFPALSRHSAGTLAVPILLGRAFAVIISTQPLPQPLKREAEVAPGSASLPAAIVLIP
jgi:hypothetical protein